MYSSNGSIFWVWKVSPFGNPRILRLFAPPRGLSQLVTSFIGSQCQGIPLVLLLAWTLSHIFVWYGLHELANRLFLLVVINYPILFSWKDLKFSVNNNLISFCLDLLSPIHFSMSAFQGILWIPTKRYFSRNILSLEFISFGGLK